MASACPFTIAGMPIPASNAEPPAPVTSARRDNMDLIRNLLVQLIGRMRPARRSARLTTFAADKYGRAAYPACPADSCQPASTCTRSWPASTSICRRSSAYAGQPFHDASNPELIALPSFRNVDEQLVELNAPT